MAADRTFVADCAEPFELGARVAAALPIQEVLGDAGYFSSHCCRTVVEVSMGGCAARARVQGVVHAQQVRVVTVPSGAIR